MLPLRMMHSMLALGPETFETSETSLQKCLSTNRLLALQQHHGGSKPSQAAGANGKQHPSDSDPECLVSWTLSLKWH